MNSYLIFSNFQTNWINVVKLLTILLNLSHLIIIIIIIIIISMIHTNYIEIQTNVADSTIYSLRD